jgi:uncharacterized membrane protein
VTLESLIARLLSAGTAVACALMTAGLVLSAPPLIVAGIACLVALPVVRVGVLIVAFARQRDARFALAGSIALAIIALGVALSG